ncbi:energy transducer TonB [Sphingomonas sp. H39-1-10]|uniref:energy transducer TonB n=1 Tax=Sphingomonas pollutisoli TaxID=3030829 RepID=UPI0023B9A6C0|nr:energy transducer TonB [Sphingomonas pollutisoli]MDF0489918.1 energy transducer TonB [Sphingomonas pollutisoli]
MTTYRASSDRKVAAAIGAAVLQVGLGVLLASGFTVTIPHVVTQDLKLFGVTTPPPPPPPPPPKPRPKPSIRKAGAAAPPNIRSKATEVAAPPPKIPMPVPPPIVTAPTPAAGDQASSGASDKAGPGTGAGGTGNGTGSGGAGNGDGGGRAAYQKSGRIRGSDYPRSALQARVGGTVWVSFTVEVTGQATGCTIRKSSGNPDIDATTCRLIQERYRYEPARDANGKKIRSRIENQDHTWVVGHDEDDDGDR